MLFLEHYSQHLQNTHSRAHDMFTVKDHTPESTTCLNKLKKIKAYKICFLSITIKLEIKNNTTSGENHGKNRKLLYCL